MKFIFLFLSLVTFNFAHAGVIGDVHGSFPWGTSHWTENAGTYYYDHDTRFNLGLEFGGRVGLNVGPVTIGGVADYGWHALQLNRTVHDGPPNISTDAYETTMGQLLAGGYLALGDPKKTQLIGEYYSKASQRVQYSKECAGCPFKKNDSMEGKGFGVGVGIGSPEMKIVLLYREITMHNGTLNSTDVNFLDGTSIYSAPKFSWFIFQFAINF